MPLSGLVYGITLVYVTLMHLCVPALEVTFVCSYAHAYHRKSRYSLNPKIPKSRLHGYYKWAKREAEHKAYIFILVFFWQPRIHCHSRLNGGTKGHTPWRRLTPVVTGACPCCMLLPPVPCGAAPLAGVACCPPLLSFLIITLGGLKGTLAPVRRRSSTGRTGAAAPTVSDNGTPAVAGARLPGGA